MMSMQYGSQSEKGTENMSDTEQWLNNGNCNICRRKKYCSEPCKQAKHRQEIQLAGLITKAVIKAVSQRE